MKSVNPTELILMASALGGIPASFRTSRYRGGKTGSAGHAEATKQRNRKNNRIARKSRRLNLRRGKVGRFS